MPVQVKKFALVSVGQVKVELGETSAIHDVLLAEIIDGVSKLFESITRRKLKAREYKPSGAVATNGEENRKLNGDDRLSSFELFYPEWPLNSVTSAIIKDNTLKNIIVTLDVPTDLIFDPRTSLVRLIDGDVWERGIQNIETQFNAGYADVPEDVVRACIKQVVWEFHQKDRRREGVQSVSLEGQTVTYFLGELLPEVKKALRPYVRQLFGRGGR